MRKFFLILSGLMITLLLSSCSSNVKSPNAPSTTVKMVIQADKIINPNQQGNPSPVVVKLYGIQSKVAFDQASFFELYNLKNDTANNTEPANITNIYTIVMLPDTTTKITLTLPPLTKYIGAIAAFQDLNSTTWRATTANIKKTSTLSTTSQSIEFTKE